MGSGLMRVDEELEKEINKIYLDYKRKGVKISKVECSRLAAEKLKKMRSKEKPFGFNKLEIKI